MTGKKSLYDYKLGEEAPMDGIMKDFLGKKAKLVRIAYTYQGADGTQCDCALMHKDYIDPNEDDSKEEEEDD